jgi:hypothetical protein
MSSHPLNLAVRFLLELAALVAIGFWGWSRGEGALRFVLTLGLPLIAAVLWGTFKVPGDSSASGQAPVAIPGVLRLLLELAIFACATWALYDAGAVQFAWILGVVVLVHYAVSYDRVGWLIRH